MPRVLFVHNGSPGRFAFIAEALAGRGWTGALINGPQGRDLPGMVTARWSEQPEATGAPISRTVEVAFQRGEIVAGVAADMKARGFVPDLIVGHPAWGEMLFLAQVFPDVPQIQLGELYFRSAGQYLDFDPEFPPTGAGAILRQHVGNTAQVMSYVNAARLVVPTPFQANSYPPVFQRLIRIIHEGIDTALARPRPGDRMTLIDGTPIDASVPVVTFVNRRFEPMRGFHIFLRALPEVLRAVPDARIILVGEDGPDTYGPAPPEGSWKSWMLAELGDRLDPSRVHFVGSLPYEKLVRLLSLSRAHVYFSYPSILSWSLLDAMACGALLIGSDTSAVRDVVRPGENGLLVDFFDVAGLSAALIDACRRPDHYQAMRRAARETIVRDYDRASICLPAWLALIDEVMTAGG